MAAERIEALVVAAGTGSRLGSGTPKQYLEIMGRSVLSRALDALREHPQVAGVTVVLAADDRWFAPSECAGLPDLDRVVGGATRAQSVMNGLRHLHTRKPETRWVLVHDAARPCLGRAELDRLLEAGQSCPDGAILALPVADTLKSSDPDQRMSGQVDRGNLWAAQTPQMFPLQALLTALETAMETGAEITDEAAAMQAAGARPALVMGSSKNLKITWPEDMLIAESLVRQQENGT